MGRNVFNTIGLFRVDGLADKTLPCTNVLSVVCAGGGISVIGNYGYWLIRHRYLVIVAVLLMTALAAAGIRQLGLSSDYRAYFDETQSTAPGLRSAAKHLHQKRQRYFRLGAQQRRRVYP